MKKTVIILGCLSLSLASCGRDIRTAQDVTIGNPKEKELDWKYGANDIRIQTSKITKQLMDRWFQSTHYDMAFGKPRIVITQVDNRTDQFISSDMIRDIIEETAVSDGRVTILVGDSSDEKELDNLMVKITHDPKYSNHSVLAPHQAQAPQFLAKIRLTKAITHQKTYDLEDYRMTITLYDVETQEAIDAASDVLRKKVEI